MMSDPSPGNDLLTPAFPHDDGSAGGGLLAPDLVHDPGRLGASEGLVSLLADIWPRVDDGLQIRSGGAVAVDTATLSAAAVRFDAAREELAAIADRVGVLQSVLRTLPAHTDDARAAASALAAKLEVVQEESREIAGALREAACAYEMVEIQAEHRAAVLLGESARADRLDARMTALVEQHPDAWRMALGAEFGYAVLWPSELVRQATQWGVGVGSEVNDPGAIVAGAGSGLLTLGGAIAVGLAGTGRLSREARLSGAAGPVTLIPVTPAAPGSAAGMVGAGTAVTAGGGGVAGAAGAASPLSAGSPAAVAPQSLAAATARIPGAGDSRVRVERYTMPDGSRQYAVYIAGMQSAAMGGDDAWDNASNVELYAGRMSDSYAATEAALAAAGAQPGEAIHVFGFSQGAMIGSHLALEGPYDTQTLVSLGSPVDADVGPGTLSVSVRHADDPVVGLAGGGHGQPVGASGSFIVERVSDPEVGLDEVGLPAHRLTAYAETAALVDGSSDPRVDGLRQVFDDLARADAVEVTEYAARRDAG
jgi:pimeloyl-ACP methyl ester carboxylesterase